MAGDDRPQIYLVTPPEIALPDFAPQLEAVLDVHPVACLRLDLATRDADAVARAADGLREIAHARDVPLVVAEHLALVERLGLDGVHLTDGARSVRKARAMLGAEAIVGAFCGASRHQGMSAGEAGADYIAFGPVAETGLGDGTVAAHDLFAWWSEMIELPVVAEGALDAARVAELAPVVDFFAFGEEVWREPDPVAALGALRDAMG
ncbi:thiamine phosphate synthase [Rhodosalinus halophilus]|uniref:Thiamine phosphate synthase n=1 Tax=Rhodosalinus halophilus TaxID=2259333 RepID=A0A365U4N3_9RHOB|nr:thiamine phosphate synthase [Rhodosalinus halophilus]RBI83211.1 thiamine phosphate synthase [Rhodosalinus halophilus]